MVWSMVWNAAYWMIGQGLNYANLRYPWWGTKWTLGSSTGTSQFSFLLKGLLISEETILQMETVYMLFVLQHQRIHFMTWLRARSLLSLHPWETFCLFMGILAVQTVFIWTWYHASYAIALPVLTEKCPLWFDRCDFRLQDLHCLI